jgi:hypothetical protein
VASERCVRNPDVSGIWSTVGRQADVGRPRGPYRLKSLSHVLVGTIGGTWQAPASC